MLFPRPVGFALKIVGLLVVAVVVYFVVSLVQVWLTSLEYAPQKADAIVVMGSAQYDGVPSPDLEARLNEALLLYRQGFAPLVAVTGSKQPGDVYTEAESGAAYLEAHGVPTGHILEAGGNDSWSNLADLASELRARDVHTLLMVTDPFHEDRSMAIASALGFTPHPTPTQTSPIRGLSTVPYFLKEALGVGLGRIIGFQHLHALG
jgi:uncharacterized SAM-binding protein YcdF (DUF218 family)